MTATNLPTTNLPVMTDATVRFAHVVDRIAARPEVPDGSADQVMAEVLRFVALAADVDGPVVPSRLVDVGWHEFILHTHDYTDHCAELGGYVHHIPTADDTSSSADADAYQRTRQLLAERHGPLDEGLWPAAGEDGGDCKAGECGADKCTAECKS